MHTEACMHTRGLPGGALLCALGSSSAPVGMYMHTEQARYVLVQAWSPLRKALSGDAKAACAEIGQKYGKSAAQVGLRYIADTGATFTTQTKTRAHFQEDLQIFDFRLTADEIARLAAL